ncbi:DUF3906 family protein [Paenibacillus sp. IB182496]|uniref:DUF3906 family protein n=1 Tax=Paenibacillus sabuli TaxID=2772509 RepID=A0A927BTK2_9BACL|nr:DUF3906 family protein [Paenibacillus sabuli]MBD2846037.1 DUF3906 family protein [Paenibacillus sabuli]
MYLYKIELEQTNGLSWLIVLAETDEQAFEAVDANLEKHYIKKPAVRSAAIIEKKRVVSGNGYILDPQQEQ